MGDAACRHTFTIDQANRHTARRQGLLPGSGATGVLDACRATLALHSTDPTTPYLSLHARLPGFVRADLDAELYDRHTVARIACMRTTIHVVLSQELPFFQQSCAHIRVPEERRSMALAVSQNCLGSGDPAVLDGLRARVLARLREHGPATTSELAEAIPELKTPVRYALDKPYLGSFSLGSRLVSALCTDGLLVRGRPRGGWRSSQYEYALLSDWLPGVQVESVDRREATRWLVRRYLERFGPTAAADAIWWSGLPAGDVRAALRDLGGEVAVVEVRGLPGEHLMLRQDAEELAAETALPEPSAWLLPGLDPYVMGYHRRARFLDPAHTALATDRAGNVVATVWAGGRIVGVWAQRPDGAVVCRLFAEVGGAARELLDRRAAALGAFLGGEVLPPRLYTAWSREMWGDARAA